MTEKISSAVPQKTSTNRSKFLVDVEFGVPSRQCVNYGICRIEIAQGYGRAKSSGCSESCGRALASIPKEGILQLAFFQDSLSPSTLRQHFGQGYFLVEEPYLLLPCLCDRLELPPVAIDSGVYPVLEDESVLIVRFLIG